MTREMWLRINLSDFRCDPRWATHRPEVVGASIQLLAIASRDNASVHREDAAALFGEAWARIFPELVDRRGLWVLEGDSIRCTWLSEKILETQGFLEAKRDAGRKGAAARWQTNGTAIAGGMASPSGVDAHYRPTDRPTDRPSTDSAPKAPPRERKRPATSWPDGFTLTEEMRSYATEHGVAIPEDQFERFRISAQAHGRTYSNWVAAWQQWVRNVPQFSGRLPPAPGGTHDRAMAEAERLLEQNDRRGR